MTDLDAMARRQDEALDELARMGMELASALEERLGRCKTAAELESLSRSYELIAQDVRESLALKAKLQRDRAAAGRMAAPRKARTPRPGEPAAPDETWTDNVRPLRPRTRPH